METFSAIILAAGKGVRTKLPYPKVLHPLCGKMMLAWAVDAVASLSPEEILVVVPPGHEEALREKIPAAKLAIQEQALGTGHAVMTAVEKLRKRAGTLLVACGDAPLLTDQIFSQLLGRHHASRSAATVLSTRVPDAAGYGRVVRNKSGKIMKIVEEKDADEKTKKIREINGGTYCFEMEALSKTFPALDRKNAQREYYLTDCVQALVKSKKKVSTFLIEDWQSALGVNTLAELAFANAVLNRRLIHFWLSHGVNIVDPDAVYLDADIRIGAGTVIYPFTFLESATQIGEGCKIGPQTRIIASKLGSQVSIYNSVSEEAVIGDFCSVGPFAYLRPGTILDSEVRVGDFVEIKKSSIGRGSKVPHLSYVGDATVGAGVNIGAGVITCNYDGKGKYPTIIEDGAFIGSNTNLRAPVRVGKNAVTGAGSVVTKDVNPGTTVAGVPAKVIKTREAKIHGG